MEHTTAGIGGDWVDLVRDSNALAMRFHKVARAFEASRERVANEGTAIEPPLLNATPLDPPYCLSCGLRLATADDACPCCTQKGRILKRVMELIAADRGSALDVVRGRGVRGVCQIGYPVVGIICLIVAGLSVKLGAQRVGPK